MNRKQMLATIEPSSQIWDVLIIGGGATGLGTALESASRGYRTLLVEAADFSNGTSSRSTKLIHGGVRYLRQGQLGMVRQSLRERGRLLHNAAPIVHPLNFVIPTFKSGRRWYFYAGLKAYDILAGKQNLQPARLLNAAQTATLLPTLDSENLRGGVVYGDGQFDDSALSIALATTAVQHGATVINYAPVVRLLLQSQTTTGVVIHELEQDRELELRAKVVINATGVFADSILKLDCTSALPSDSQTRITPSQGTHLILSKDFMPGEHAMLIPDTDDGRVLFAIPWLGHTLIGTTDIAVEQVALEPKPRETEIEYLLEHTNRYLTQKPSRNDVLSMFAGLRPLVGQGGKSTSQLSREHEIVISSSGLISVIGGKWTTYRQMGEDVVNVAAKIGNLPTRPSVTALLKLSVPPTPELLSSPSAADHRLHPLLTVTQAEVERAVASQMARSIEDVLARRSRALFLNAKAALEVAPTVAHIMATQLGHPTTWQLEQVKSFTRLAASYLPA